MFDKTVKYEKTYAGPIWQGTISYIGTYEEIAKAFEIVTGNMVVVREASAKLGTGLIPVTATLIISPDIPEKGHLTISGYLSNKWLTADVFNNTPTAQQVSAKESESLIELVAAALEDKKSKKSAGPYGVIKLPSASVADFSAVVDSSIGVIEQLTLRRSRMHTITPAKEKYFLYLHAWEPLQGDLSARTYSQISVVASDGTLSEAFEQAIKTFGIEMIGEPYVVSFTQSAIEGSESGYRITASFVCI
jgi:hypothetical protein